MGTCSEHNNLDAKLDMVIETVTRIDHGLNGTNGSIGLVERVKKIEGTIERNSPIWSKMRGLTSNTSLVIRTLIVGILMALGSGLGAYIWVTVSGAVH